MVSLADTPNEPGDVFCLQTERRQQDVRLGVTLTTGILGLDVVDCACTVNIVGMFSEPLCVCHLINIYMHVCVHMCVFVCVIQD